MNNFNRALSFILLLFFGVFLVPKEYVHSFFGHDDTICFARQGISFSKLHQHCKILQIQVPVFFGTDVPGPHSSLVFIKWLIAVPVQTTSLIPLTYKTPRAPPRFS